MKLFGKNLFEELLIVAEVGVNHEGDPQTALALIDAAAEAGADAVKFQTYTPDRYINASDAVRYERVSRFALSKDTHRQAAERAAAHGIGFFSTPLTEDVVPFLDTLCPTFKIASGDLTFEPVIRRAAATGKPLVLSTGASTIDEIDRAVDWVRDETGTDDLADRLALLHCVSAYPTPIEQANVRAVPYLAERYGLITGYSNHVIGPAAALAAVALGARIVEVHFTDNKDGRDFRDHALSFDPADLAAFVVSARSVQDSLGSFEKRVQPCEEIGVSSIRKGLVAARDLPAGTALTTDDLMYARPATEFSAADRDSLIGRVLSKPLRRGDIVPQDAFQAP